MFKTIELWFGVKLHHW